MINNNNNDINNNKNNNFNNVNNDINNKLSNNDNYIINSDINLLPNSSLSSEKLLSINTNLSLIYKKPNSKKLEIPSFILSQENCIEKCNLLYCLFSCCLDKNNLVKRINAQELLVYYKIKNDYIDNYSDKNKNHENSLKFLFLKCLKCDLNSSLISDNWKKLGFESNNPRNEFGNGGYMCLLFLIYFMEQDDIVANIYNNNTNNIINNGFKLAKICRELCIYVKLALGFIDKNEKNIESIGKDIKYINVKQFKNLIRNYYIEENENYLFEIMSHIVDMCFNEIKTNINNNYNDEEILKNIFNKEFYNELNNFNINKLNINNNIDNKDDNNYFF